MRLNVLTSTNPTAGNTTAFQARGFAVSTRNATSNGYVT